MTLEEYRESNNAIIQNVGISNELLCNLDSTHNRTEFLEVYKFYQETLEINVHYGIDPAHFFFVNSDTINARAGLSNNGTYLIGINRGTINWLIDNFKLNDSLILDADTILFDKLEPFTDTSINNLMYQAGCHFTFYHELAHLIQKSEYLELNMEENPLPIENFDINRHLLELDADTFSALCLGTHIMQYSENLFGEDVSKPLVEALIVLFSIPIILYLLSFTGNCHNLYFQETTHPHPAIRLTNFLMVLTHYCNGVLEGKDRGFTANQGDMFLNAIDIAEELQEEFFNNNTVSLYKQNIAANRPQVMQYLSELIELNESLETTSKHKWNLHNA